MVYVDSNKLEAYQMSAMDVVRSINESNVTMPAGNIRLGHMDYPIYANSQFNDLEGVLDLPVRLFGQAPVRVRDVAVVRDSSQIQFRGGEIVTDGPWAEAKEVAGGYAILEFRTQAEAVESGRRLMEIHKEHWPEGGDFTVEIRPILQGPPGE